jgi:hypothetical protein
MRAYVLTGYVGTKNLITIAITVKNQTRPTALDAVPKPTRTEEYTKFQGHVETWKAVFSIQGRSRQVVDPEPRVTDDVGQLVNTNLAAIVFLKSAARNETAIMHRKDKCIE